jgi:uncharacterized protein YaaN involved in tellurite resistance
LAYLNDVILFTENLEDHLIELRRILGKFEKADLKLKPEKLKNSSTKTSFSKTSDKLRDYLAKYRKIYGHRTITISKR